MKYGFFIFMFSALAMFSSYVSTRGFQALRDFPTARYVYLFLFVALFLISISSMLFARNLSSEFAKLFSFVGFSFLIVLIYLALSFLLVDIVRIFNSFIHFAPQGMFVFRKWAFFATLAILGLTMIVGNYKFNHPSVENLNIQVEGKALQDKKIRIVFASDLHLGVSINKKKLQEYLDLINAQNPDLVLFGGDVVDNAVKPVIDQNMAEELRQIKAKYGVYTISGNHEYYGENPYLFQQYLKENTNIHFLRDSAVLINDSFYLVGRDDRSNPHRKKIAELIGTLDKTKAFVLLDHQPFELEESEKNNIDLQLSGHTHNGQLFPGNLIVKGMYENPYGYSKRTHTHYYVSSGLGLWGPQYRIGTKSELVVIDFNY